MTRQEIITVLTPLAAKAFGIENITLKDSMSAANVAEWTSLSFMNLIASVEKEFGFKFKIMELFPINDMGALISAIEKKNG